MKLKKCFIPFQNQHNSEYFLTYNINTTKSLSMRILLFIIFMFFLHFGHAQNCSIKNMTDTKEFKYEPKFGEIEIDWYPEWLEHTNGVKKIPEPLNPQPKWAHPYMKNGYTAAMHEGPRSSDVSNRPGPTQNNPKVQYFSCQAKRR